MTPNPIRAGTLEQALHAIVTGDQEQLRLLLTDDVKLWSPEISAASRDELLESLHGRDSAFDDIDINMASLDVGGHFACTEWSIAMSHVGPIELADGTIVEPSGLRIEIHGVTVAEFIDDRICALRQYWDAQSLLAQLAMTAGP